MKLSGGFRLGLAVGVASLFGCVEAEDAGDEECLPGDIDCSDDPAGGGGKADAWDYDNDPARLSKNLQYRLSELPGSGHLDEPVWRSRFPDAPADMNRIWSETYFPSSRGSTNVRWQGSSEPSALEKYDAAFNGVAAPASQPSQRCGPQAKAEWDAYIASAGPAARWHTQNFQGMANGYNGRDDDANNETDECYGGKDGYGPDKTPAGWWGLCHAWTPASILEPEAINPVTYNGVTFQRSDIHALLMTLYDRNDAVMLGGRCNSREFNPDNLTSANDECADTNPGSMHVVLANFLGIADRAIAFDRTFDSEVWNQPIYGYEVTQQDEVNAEAANQCVGAQGTSWTYNKKAKKLYEVKMTVSYVVEAGASAEVQPMEDYLSEDEYHYILEVGKSGKVLGGRWCTDSNESHPDFLWAPIRVSTSSYGRNPSVSLENVRTLLGLSVRGDGDDDDGGTGGTGQEFASTGTVEIPDNDEAGASSQIVVSGVSGTGGCSVSVDITHTYRGDLEVVLQKDGHDVRVLHDHAGGSADNLVETYTIPPNELGADRNGTYTLRVIDNAAQDTGTLQSWKLVF